MDRCRSRCVVVLAMCAVALGLGLAVGCAGPQRAGELPAEVPSYRELAERYNANLAKMDQLWTSSVVAIRWVDEDGKKQFEQGEGHFIFVPPKRVALTVGKLGDVLLWAGADEQRYWLFDLGEAGKAYVGKHENVGKACSEPLPLPVLPGNVPYLLGLLPLDLEQASVAPPVEVLNGQYLIEPPGLRLRMLLDPKTALPSRVDLVGDTGNSVLIAQLSNYETMEAEGLPPGQAAKIARRAMLTAVGQDASLSLTFSDATDGKRFDKINPKAFDFDVLLKAHRPSEVVVLDAQCE